MRENDVTNDSEVVLCCVHYEKYIIYDKNVENEKKMIQYYILCWHIMSLFS